MLRDALTNLEPVFARVYGITPDALRSLSQRQLGAFLADLERLGADDGSA
jgi:hypothetical protein